MIHTLHFLVYTDSAAGGSEFVTCKHFNFSQIRESYEKSLPKSCKIIEKFERTYNMETTYVPIPGHLAEDQGTQETASAHEETSGRRGANGKAKSTNETSTEVIDWS